jgi:glutathione synthase/RimK-type ligase-like ATP-grasp enzyme
MEYSPAFRLKSYCTWLFDRVIGISNAKARIKYITANRIYKQEHAGTYKSNDADIIIWSYYPTKDLRKACYVWDILLMAAVASSKRNFTVYYEKDIEKFSNKTILYTLIKDRFDYLGFENYALAHQHISQMLEKQNNNVYPSYHDVLYWENKIYMYSQFQELGISTPRTVFYTNIDEVIQKEQKFPFLIKVPHSSGSYGLFNVTDKQMLQSLKNDPIILENTMFIIQERLNITMDMRVILVGNEIVHHYWRKNKDKSKWKTTSTSSGSSVDFSNFPEQWRAFIIDSFKKLNLITGAFDVGWQNDDLSTQPYFFEVSPSYDVNPKTTIDKHLYNYGKYKKQLLFRNSYDRLFVEQTYNFKGETVKLFLEKGVK